MSELAVLGLGSNLGDCESNLAAAITALGIYNDISDINSASFFESEALYETNQPKFLNTVISCNTEFSAFQLLDAVQHTELLLGRPKKREKNQPRIIDIDILCYGDSYIETEELVIPHPDIINRKFVLVPFCELMPDYKIEKIGKTISELLNLCPDQSQVVKHVMEKNA
jgi:2-amino-4-hydroxy-6-hydroxymethyldihydropteridine diphosphokinase